MLSSVKRALLILIILTGAAILGLFIYTHGRTYSNSEDEIGNTAGNIYNGGLFCEQGNKIYFSNDYDKGSLYSMNLDCTEVNKISDDIAAYINADDNYLYYSRANNKNQNSSDFFTMLNNNGVYRIYHNGTRLKAFTGNPGGFLMLKGNYLYFQAYDAENGLCLYRYNISTVLDKLLLKDSVIPAVVTGNHIYYTAASKENTISAIDLSSYTAKTKYQGSFAYPIFQGDYIYYIDMEKNNQIYRMNRDGSNPTLLVKKNCTTYNISNSGKYLYYQMDAKKDHRICRLDLETMENETLLKGQYKQINVTKYYVFFRDIKNSNTYRIAAEIPGKARIFTAK
jgi:hypothetical protein